MVWSQNLTEEKAAAAGVRLVAKDELFREADYLSLHLVLGERTRSIVGEPELAMMKPPAALVNMSRGPLIDEQHRIFFQDTVANIVSWLAKASIS